MSAPSFARGKQSREVKRDVCVGVLGTCGGSRKGRGKRGSGGGGEKGVLLKKEDDEMMRKQKSGERGERWRGRVGG